MRTICYDPGMCTRNKTVVSVSELSLIAVENQPSMTMSQISVKPQVKFLVIVGAVTSGVIDIFDHRAAHLAPLSSRRAVSL